MDVHLRNAGDSDDSTAEIDLFAAGTNVCGPTVASVVMGNSSCRVAPAWKGLYVPPLQHSPTDNWCSIPGGAVTWPIPNANVPIVTAAGAVTWQTFKKWLLGYGYTIVATASNSVGGPGPVPGNNNPYDPACDPYVGIYTTALVIDAGIGSGVAQLIAMGGAAPAAIQKVRPDKGSQIHYGIMCGNPFATAAQMQLTARVLDLEKDRAEIFGILHSHSVREFAAFGGQICSAQVGLTIGKQSVISNLRHMEPQKSRVHSPYQHLDGEIVALDNLGLIRPASYSKLSLKSTNALDSNASIVQKLEGYESKLAILSIQLDDIDGGTAFISVKQSLLESGSHPVPIGTMLICAQR